VAIGCDFIIGWLPGKKSLPVIEDIAGDLPDVVPQAGPGKAL
jgi:hypothetical protein